MRRWLLLRDVLHVRFLGRGSLPARHAQEEGAKGTDKEVERGNSQDDGRVVLAKVMRDSYEERTEGRRGDIRGREEALYAAEVPSAKELRGAHAEARLAHAHRKSP